VQEHVVHERRNLARMNGAPEASTMSPSVAERLSAEGSLLLDRSFQFIR
jgi:hypothetical protein